MSAQTLNITLVDLCRSEADVTLYHKDPETALAGYNMTDEERERVVAKDMGWLYTYGIHPYILVQFALAVGVEIPQYVQQLQEATK